MRLFVEIAWENLAKHGEELCGDCVRVATTPQSFIVVLSDGLGSGVKANIMATLTAEIAASMFQRGASVEEVVSTLVATLPECSVRKLAYATFAVLLVQRGRDAYLVEYDTPPLILIRDGQIWDVPRAEREVEGRRIHEAHFSLQEGDYMVMVSDGYVHAGVGGLYRLGWGWQNIAVSVRRWVQTGGDAHSLVRALTNTANRLYGGRPGDDSTAIAMRVRQTVQATIWTGPPADRMRDEEATARLMSSQGYKVICGGTTAQIAARVLGQDLKVDWVPPGKRGGVPYRARGTPPTARLDGVDLVTEGILTLGQAIGLLEQAQTVHDLPPGEDAASRLARILLSADEIHFLVGTAINPNQVADVIRGESMRMLYVKELVRQLERRNKSVTLERI